MFGSGKQERPPVPTTPAEKESPMERDLMRAKNNLYMLTGPQGVLFGQKNGVPGFDNRRMLGNG